MSDSTMIIGALPPPPGVVPNFVDPVDHMKNAIALHTIMLSAVTLCISIRVYARYHIQKELGLDDYCCLASYVLTITFSGLSLRADALAFGRHMWDVPALQALAASKILAFSEYVYMVLTATIKLSCLLFYRRVFAPNKIMKILINGGISFLVVAYTAMLFLTIFDCTPVYKAWNPMAPGNCFPVRILPYISGILNAATDIYVLVLPIPTLWGLQLKTSRKIRVMAIFSLGIFATSTSIVRLAETPPVFNSPDATWNQYNIGVFGVIEVNIGIICACSLAFPAFFRRFWPDGLGSSIIRLFTSTFTRRGDETRTGSQNSSKRHYRNDTWSGNQGEYANSQTREYLRLNGKGNTTEMQTIKPGSETSLKEREIHGHNIPNGDVEAWADIGKPPSARDILS